MSLRHTIYELLAIAALFLALGMAIVALKAPSARRDAEFMAKRLMTETEMLFFGTLRSALPEFHIFPQVAMGALLAAPNWRDRGYFSQKIVDFLRWDCRAMPTSEEIRASILSIKDQRLEANSHTSYYNS